MGKKLNLPEVLRLFRFNPICVMGKQIGIPKAETLAENIDNTDRDVAQEQHRIGGKTK